MPDGSITFSTALDNAELEKQLSSLTKKVDTLNDKINQKQAERMPLADQAAQLGVQLDIAKAKLYEMQNASTGAFSSGKIKEQQLHVNGLQTEWDGVQGRVERYDVDIQKATIELDRNKIKAGGIAQELSAAGSASNAMGPAIARAGKSLDTFKKRLSSVVRSALVFVVITQALAKMRGWIGNIVKVNPQAAAGIARLKAALLTLAQPLVNVIIPALITLVNILTQVITAIASFTSVLFGTTIEQSAASAKALNKETAALNGTGAAAKKAGKALAAFDEINLLNDDSDGGSSSAGIAPDFSGIGNANWLKDRLGDTAGMVSAGLLLGGIALIAIGAATGSLKAVIAGLLLIGSGIYIADETGTLQSWSDALGLNNVKEFKIAAAILGGIALVAIGAALGNILMVIAGLGLIGTTIVYSEKSGQMGKWADTLGLDKAAAYITSGLLIGGIALVVIGALMKNILMIVGGLGLLGAGVKFGVASGTFQNWWDVLCLPQVSGWLTTALLLGGIGLLVIGIATGNLPMMIAGLALLGGGITFGVTSGTFSRWIDDIKTGLINGWGSIKNWWNANVGPKLTLSYWHDKFDTIREALVDRIKAAVNGGIDLFNIFIDWVNSKMRFTWEGITIAGKQIVPAGSAQLFTIPHIPALATGAVIPPNQEFLAMLGDQKSGTNIEAPLETIVEAFKRVSGDMTLNQTIMLDGEVVYRNQKKVAARHGVSLIQGVT